MRATEAYSAREGWDGMLLDNAVAKDALALMENANALLTKSLTLVREKSTRKNIGTLEPRCHTSKDGYFFS